MGCIHVTHDIPWFGVSLPILEGRSEAVSFFNSDVVFFSHPLLAFLRVSRYFPSSELLKGDMMVLPLSTVDNSALSPSRLTIPIDPAYPS
jgi:hypothetical protein